ncbi:MAG: hypothetical protein ACNS62_03565 [Candidatus Cyclobacteriaceae bacterium M3_2C_046]
MKLSRLKKNNKYKIHRDDPDILGWKLVMKGATLGRVKDLIFQPGQPKAKYVDFQLYENDKPHKDSFFLPMDQFSLDQTQQLVIAEFSDREFYYHYPRYSKFVPNDYEFNLNLYFHELGKRKKPSRPQIDKGPRDILDQAGNQIPAKTQSNQQMDRTAVIKKIEYLESEKEIRRKEAERDLILIDQEIEILRLKLERENAKRKDNRVREF